MAWLIALALFWWVGSTIASGIDFFDGRRVHNELKEADNQERFRHRLYVVAWPYYQKLEKQAIQEWENHGFERHPFVVREVFDEFQTGLFGAPIEQIAFQKAFEYLQEHGFPVYRPSPFRNSQSRMHERYVLAHSSSEVDFAELSYEVHRDIFSIVPLEDFYMFYYAEQMQADELMKFVPPVVMPEVGYYKFKGYSYERGRTPSDHNERCHLYREQHPSASVPSIDEFINGLYE